MKMSAGKMQKMMKQAQQAQEKLQEEIDSLRVEGTAGGGVVSAMVDGSKNVLEVKIAPEALEDADAEMVSDLVLAAISDAQRRADEQVQEKVGGLSQLMGGLPGF